MSYAYDAMGRRTSKAAQGATPTQFLYDGANAVQETVGSTINPILVGLGIDERFARNDTTGRMYFLSDAINSTLALTDSSGAVQNTYSYDPYGNTMQSNASFTNPYQYAGREADAAGLYYYRARYYSPPMGGFISEDPAGPAGGQLSFYAYVGGDPVGFNDPSGLGGFGFNAGGSAQAGAFNGGATQANSGVGLFWGNGLNVGGYTASGSFSGNANFEYLTPGQQDTSGFSPDNGYSSMVFGASAGLGVGIWGTNANNAQQLLGPFDTSTLNVGFITAQWAEDASGTYTWSLGFAKGLGFDFNRYQVVTTAAGTFYRRRSSICK